MAGTGPGGTSEHDEVIDLTGHSQPSPPPVPGAQWDELHGQWQVWDDAAEGWMIVGDHSGARIAPLEEVPLLPPHLARELIHADEIDRAELHVVDLDRIPEPAQPVPGAQWNEVLGRWERWDGAFGAWVEATAQQSAERPGT